MSSITPRYITLIYAIIVGTMSGFISGLLGVTGSVIVLPLAILFGLFDDYKTAIGTILFTSDPFQSIFAVIEYAKQKKIDYLIAAILFFGYVAGAYVGSKYNRYFTEKKLKYLTAFILFILSVYTYYNAYKL